ncbi:MAG: hypothetical protein AABZ39_05600 [Spirochaetota bacterium]
MKISFVLFMITAAVLPLMADTDTEIIIDCAKNKGKVKLLSGFVHGVTFDPKKDYTREIQLLYATKPAYWSMAAFNNNVHDFVIKGGFQKNLGTKMQYNLQAAFNMQWGFPIILNTPEQPCRNKSRKDRSCFNTFADLTNAFTQVVEKDLSEVAGIGLRFDYFEILAEPNWGWVNVSDDQKLELFRIGYDAVQRHFPKAKVLGPNYGFYDKAYFTKFIKYCADMDIRLGGFSWHNLEGEDDEPDIHRIPKKAAEIRQLMEDNGLRKERSPELHMNEYSFRYHLIPGWEAGYLYYMEEAGIDYIAKACWEMKVGFRQRSTCWDGFNGMFDFDSAVPTARYWVNRYYADMDGGLRLITKKISEERRTVALASRHDDKNEIRVLIGAYSPKTERQNVMVSLENFPYAGKPVQIDIYMIPNNKNRTVPVPQCESRTLKDVKADGDKRISFSLPASYGEAYYAQVK